MRLLDANHYPPDLVELKRHGAEMCERDGRHEWRLDDSGWLAPAWECWRCWGTADVPTDDRPTKVPRVAVERYAISWASEGCDRCRTMRAYCRAPDDHFSPAEIERRRRKTIESFADVIEDAT